MEARGSTKTRAAVYIALWHIHHPCAPPVTFLEDGSIDKTLDPPPGSNELPIGQAPVRVVIMLDFPGIRAPLVEVSCLPRHDMVRQTYVRQALEAHGLRVATLIGEDKPATRQTVISSLSEESGPQVLIISSIAKTGINLSAAHILIVMVGTVSPRTSS